MTPGKTAAFGILVASCEHGDLRVGPEGVLVYADDGRWNIALDDLPNGRAALLDEMAQGLAGAPLTHDGDWGRANLEVCVAILAAADSGRQERPDFDHPVAPPTSGAMIERVLARMQRVD